MVKDVTNSPKDVHDFWYNSEDIAPETNNNYNQLVDHLVSTMKPQSEPTDYNLKSDYTQPFDTQAYRNYKELVNKEKEQIDPNNLTESIYKLGFKIDTLLAKLIGQLDEISTTLEKDLNDNKEEEITVNPLTHKVTYNKETNVYNVVEREDKK